MRSLSWKMIFFIYFIFFFKLEGTTFPSANLVKNRVWNSIDLIEIALINEVNRRRSHDLEIGRRNFHFKIIFVLLLRGYIIKNIKLRFLGRDAILLLLCSFFKHRVIALIKLNGSQKRAK